MSHSKRIPRANIAYVRNACTTTTYETCRVASVLRVHRSAAPLPNPEASRRRLLELFLHLLRQCVAVDPEDLRGFS